MTVTVYSTVSCPYCSMLKEFLHEKNVDFVEKMVDQDDVAREEMMKESGGFLGVPFTVVETKDKKYTVVGFDKNRLEELFR